MMLRSLAVAALTLAGSGVACAQSVYLYVAPSASVYVTPTPNGGVGHPRRRQVRVRQIFRGFHGAQIKAWRWCRK
jgi:hypothetical protein